MWVTRQAEWGKVWEGKPIAVNRRFEPGEDAVLVRNKYISYTATTGPGALMLNLLPGQMQQYDPDRNVLIGEVITCWSDPTEYYLTKKNGAVALWEDKPERYGGGFSERNGAVMLARYRAKQTRHRYHDLAVQMKQGEIRRINPATLEFIEGDEE